MIALKFLREGRVGPFSRVRWPAPESRLPWVHSRGPGGVCTDRVHACRVSDLPDWIDDELWRVELDGDVAVDCGKLVADRGRLIERVDAWDRHAAIELATACTLRARDAAAGVVGAGEPEAIALAALGEPAELLQATTEMLARPGFGSGTGPGDAAGRALAYAGDAARHVVGAQAAPATAPMHAAAAAFIASHAAALAAGDVAAARAERAWQASWLAERLALTSA